MAVGEHALTSWKTAVSMFGYLNDEQTLVEKLIDQATARMELYTKRKLAARDYDAVQLDGTGRDYLLLPEYPVNSIESVNLDSSRTFGDATLLDSSDYIIDSDAGIIRLFSGVFPGYRGSVLVSYNAGFASTSQLYPMLEGGCLETVHWLKTRYAGGIGKRTETNADGMSVGYEIDLPVNVRSMLDEIMRRDR